jgi:hypothetical protein
MAVQINPILLATKDASTNYINQKLKELESKKGKEHHSPDFATHLKDLADQYMRENNDPTDIDITDLEDVGIASDTAADLHQQMIADGIINNRSDGLINLTLDTPEIHDYLTQRCMELGIPNPEDWVPSIIQQASHQKTRIGAFTKQLFCQEPWINSQTSEQIWHQLHSTNIIDNYGVLLTLPTDPTMDTSLAPLQLTQAQQDHVMSLLHNFRGISYLKYMDIWTKNNDHPASAIAPRFYVRKGTSTQSAKLTREEVEEVQKTSLLEWTLMLMIQRRTHKINVQREDKRKKEKEKIEVSLETEIQKGIQKNIAHMKRREAMARAANQRKKSKEKAS